MLRRLTLGFAGIAAAAVTIAGCASGGTTQNISVGPTFAPQSLYATNSTQNAISIYNAGVPDGSGPTNQIGGSNTTLNGPQYLAFDASQNLFVTNWQASTKLGSLIEIKALATGNVIPFNSYNFGALHARGIAPYTYTVASTSTSLNALAIAGVDPTVPLTFSSQLDIFTTSFLFPARVIAGPLTGLNVPSGVATDKNNNIFVTNLQGATVEVFNIPSPSPTPSPTATPSPTPSPTATPTGATPSPTPTAVPTPTPFNAPPVSTIAGAATGIGQPTGIALDTNGKIYVSDQASSICGGGAKCPAILIFPAAAVSASYGAAPSAFIAGSNTKLVAPTDVKVDSSGKIYVADSTTAGAGVIYVFAAGASGNVAPSSTLTSPGTVIGIALTP